MVVGNEGRENGRGSVFSVAFGMKCDGVGMEQDGMTQCS